MLHRRCQTRVMSHVLTRHISSLPRVKKSVERSDRKTSGSGSRRTTRFAALPFEDAGASPPTALTWDPYTDMAPQVYSWTCAACSLDWVLRATGVAPDHTRQLAVEEIGYPDNINPLYGLMDASGGALQGVYEDLYGVQTDQGWFDFDTVYALAQDATGQMSGGAWYHWVAIRGIQGANLWIANSAPGYKGIWDVLSRADFNRLGPFSVVYLV